MVSSETSNDTLTRSEPNATVQASSKASNEAQTSPKSFSPHLDDPREDNSPAPTYNVSSSPPSSRASLSPNDVSDPPVVKQPNQTSTHTNLIQTAPLIPSFSPFVEELKNVTQNPNLSANEQLVINGIFGPFIANLAARAYLAMPKDISNQFQSFIKPYMPQIQNCPNELSFTSTQMKSFQDSLTKMWVQGDLFQQFFGREEIVAKSEYYRLNEFYLQAENDKRILFQQLQQNQSTQIQWSTHNSVLEERNILSSELSKSKNETKVLKKQYEAICEALKKCHDEHKSVNEANRLLNMDGPRLGSTCAPATMARTPSTTTTTTPPTTSLTSPPASSPPPPTMANFPEPAKPAGPVPVPSSSPSSSSASAASPPPDPFSLTWPPKTKSSFQHQHRHLWSNIITTYPDQDFFAKEKIQNDLKIVSRVLQVRTRILKAIPSTLLQAAFKKVDHGPAEEVSTFSSLLTRLAEARSTTELLEFLRNAPPNIFNKDTAATKFFTLPFVANSDAWARMIYLVTKQQVDREAVLYILALLAPGLHQAVTRIQCLHDPPYHVERVLGTERCTTHQALLHVVTTLVAFYQLQWENNANLGRPPIGMAPKLQQQSSGFLTLQQLQEMQRTTKFPVSIIDLHKRVSADFEAPAAFTTARANEIQSLHEIFETELHEAAAASSTSSSAKKQRRHPPTTPQFQPRVPFQPYRQPRSQYHPFRPPFRPRF